MGQYGTTQMKLAFCLFKYFPYGGLQRDFLRIAQVCQQRGHEIHVYCMQWEGEIERAFKLHLIKVAGLQNHTRCYNFAKKLAPLLAKENYDVVIGFNKMPHLDIYYAADVCYQARVRQQRNAFYRLLPRYKKMLALEKSVFAPNKPTQIMLLSALQKKDYVQYYQTESVRFELLTPGIAKDRLAPANASEIRAAIRSAYHIQPEQILLLMVGSGFKTKGLDRSIKALAALPKELQERTRLFVIGQDNSTPFLNLAKKLNVAKYIQFLGGRSDVPNFLLAADFLLHPSYHENTGTALLEAIVSGLPVLTLDVCGYAHYVLTAQAGMVLSSPFEQASFNQALQKMLLSPERVRWQKNGLEFAKQADIYNLPEKAADLIERIKR